MLCAIVCNHGQMTLEEIREECPANRFVPILVIRADGQTIIPVFESPKVAHRFVQRNLPKDWLFGHIDLDLKDGDIVPGTEFQVKRFDYPHKSKNLDIEVLEFEDQEVEVKQG